MATKKQIRVMHYRKAEHATGCLDTKSLEEYIKGSIDTHKTSSSRRVKQDDVIFDCLSAKHKADEGIYIHIAKYVPGDKANTVKKAGADNLEVVSPPQDQEFVDGALAALISGNNVFFCSDRLTEGALRRYLSELLHKTSKNHGDEYSRAASFQLTKKADADKVSEIKREGVKSISVNASLTEAEHHYIDRKSLQSSGAGNRMLGSIAHEIRAIFEKDKSLSDIHDDENLFLNLEIRLNRKMKGGQIGRDRALKLATDILTNEDEGFAIITTSGKRITHDQIVLKRETRLTLDGKSFERTEAWKELKGFKDSLLSSKLIPV